MASDDDSDGFISPIKAIKKITRDTQTRGLAFAKVFQANLASMQKALSQQHNQVQVKAIPKTQADIVDINTKKTKDITYKSKIKRNKEIFDPYSAYANSFKTSNYTKAYYQNNSEIKTSSSPCLIDESKVVDAVILEEEELDTKK